MRRGWRHRPILLAAPASHWPTGLPPFLGPVGAPSFGFSNTIKFALLLGFPASRACQNLVFQAGAVGRAWAMPPSDSLCTGTHRSQKRPREGSAAHMDRSVRGVWGASKVQSS